jgi:hypothetical protein
MSKKGIIMSKKILLSSVSVIISSVATYAMQNHSEDDVQAKVNDGHATPLSKMAENEGPSLAEQELSQEAVQHKLSADLIVDFAKFSYAPDKKTGWSVNDKAIYNKLINDGWKLEPFSGTTGTAYNQVESESGLLAFKDDQVVIATRGTEMTNWNDWMTNFRFSRSPVTRFFSTTEANKLDAITAQFFGGVDGEVANGFLQTHLSSWGYIKESILKYAQSVGKSTKDLHYTITGHSKGAAKAQLNALNLLTDSTLGIGVDYLEKSFILADSDVIDLGASGFYGIGIKTEPKNQGNVETVVFESPRLFGDTAAGHVNKIIGKPNLVRVENVSPRGSLLDDPVVHLTPKVVGFEHAGTTVPIDGKGTFIGRHMMGNVGEAAIPGIEAHRHNVAQEASATSTKLEGIDIDPASQDISSQFQETESHYFGKTVVDTFVSGTSTVLNGFASGVKKAWDYIWN